MLGIGEGGLVLFGDANKAQEFRTWLNFGFSGSRDSSILGTNAKMSEIQAAYGHAVLDRWEQEKAEWRKARNRVEELEGKHNLKSPTFLTSVISPYWIIQTEELRILEIESKLKERNIETRRWWSYGLHKMPTFKKYSLQAYPISDHVALTTLGLPFFRDLGDKEVRAIDSVLSIC